MSEKNELPTGSDEPTGQSGRGRPGDPDPTTPTHDPTGLDLARQIARGISSGGGGWSKPKPRRRPRGVQSSGAHPGFRDPQPLGNALKRVMADEGWTTQVNVHMLLARWPVLVGPINADHSSPESYVNEVLTVRADSTAWASQMRAFAPQLVAKLNSELGDGTVTRVVVKGPDAPSWKHGARSVPGRGPRDTYG